MANSWFRFKQFTVHQRQAAMKVTTDACLFGALLPHFHPSAGVRMLDIGTGTGLLSLMAAQRNPGANITAVEIDKAAAEEAAGNIADSPFSRNISIVQQDIFQYDPVEPFQHIFSNPPFYEHQLASPHSKKNIAHHSTALTLTDLLAFIDHWLLPTGTASLLLPYYREEEAVRSAMAEKLFAQTIVRVKQTPGHAYFRSIVHFARTKADPTIEEIVIRDTEDRYTPAFITLLQPFYLNL